MGFTFVLGGYRREIQMMFGALARSFPTSEHQDQDKGWTGERRKNVRQAGASVPSWRDASGTFSWFPRWFKTFLAAWSVLALLYITGMAVCYGLNRSSDEQGAKISNMIKARRLPLGCRHWVNSLEMKFVRVGNVLFGVWKTRVRDFETFANTTGCDAASEWRDPGFSQGPTHPVVHVNWDDAAAFCRWLTQKERREGLLSASQYYRLPTDAEWNEAVGLEGGNGTFHLSSFIPPSLKLGRTSLHPSEGTYPWGNVWPPSAEAGNFAVTDDGYQFTSPVGSFKSNRFGLYDMSGNVWEWCMDFFGSDADSHPGQDGLAPGDPRYAEGFGEARATLGRVGKGHIVRGGSWSNVGQDCLSSSYRGLGLSECRAGDRGFRCVIAELGVPEI